MNEKSNISALSFAGLAVGAAAYSQIAPERPDHTYITGVMVIVAIALTVLFFAKKGEEAPVNWLTIDVLFAATYSIVHFAYFIYWLLGFFEGQVPLWNINYARAGGAVNYGLAMYATCLCVFLAGFHFIRSKRARPIINGVHLPENASRQWERLGRMLTLGGFMGFAGYVVLVGPEVVFGSYSGTNNKGFLPNIFFVIGQNLLIAGVAVSVASGHQVFARRKGRKLLGFGFLNLLIVAVIAAAMGLHGDRSTLMWIVLGSMVAYSEYSSPFKAKTLAISAFVILFLLGFIVAFRGDRKGRQDLGIANTLNRTFVNFGTSAVCGFVAVDYTEKNGYFNGRLQLVPLAGIIPFGRKLFKMSDNEESSSAMLLTKLIMGRVGKGVAGTGSSIFADFYFDFGFAITAILFLITGLACKWAQNASRESTSILWSVGYTSLVVYMSIVSRYSLIGGIIRLVVYSVIFAAAAAMFLGIPTKFRRMPSARMPFQPVDIRRVEPSIARQ